MRARKIRIDNTELSHATRTIHFSTFVSHMNKFLEERENMFESFEYHNNLEMFCQ